MDETARMGQLLDQLHAESVARRAELRAIAEQLPATLSRRALLKSMLVDVRHAPRKGAIVKRAVRKMARAPRAAARRIVERSR